jgi:hypothetical protein
MPGTCTVSGDEVIFLIPCTSLPVAFRPSRVDSDDEVLVPPSTRHSAFGARASDDAPSVAHSLTDVMKKFQFSFLHAALLLCHVMVNMRVLFCTINFPFFSPDILCSLCPPPPPSLCPAGSNVLALIPGMVNVGLLLLLLHCCCVQQASTSV